MGKAKDAAAKDEAGDSKKKGASSDLKLKFEYISEVSPKITNFQGKEQKPSFINVLSKLNDSPEEEGPASFYIYTAVGN